MEIGNIPMTSLNDKPNRSRRSSTTAGGGHYHLDIRQYERVDRIAGEDNAFRVFTTIAWAARAYVTRKIVLAPVTTTSPTASACPAKS